MLSIQENFLRIQEQIAEAALRTGRNPTEVRLVGVSKFHSPTAMREAYDAGLNVFGESRVQEAERKYAELQDVNVEWHLVGALQTNKIRRALPIFDLIHSVDSPKLITALHAEAEKQERNVHVLLQLNLAGEETKRGTDEAGLEAMLDIAKTANRVKILGLMTLPPYEEDPEEVRPFFHRLRELAERYREDLISGDDRLELSMGMSHDFPVAIEEGATLVRIGTALFGDRSG